jgi:hypothetical protein
VYKIAHNKKVREERKERKGKKKTSQAWQCVSVLPALGRLRQEDPEFETNLGYRERKQKYT